MKTGIWALVLCVAATGVGIWMILGGKSQPPAGTETKTAALADVKLPSSFSSNAQIGKRAFAAKCADCHGENAVGQDGVAPPLVHIIYEPSHHGDESFQRAVALGVRGHHWAFGDMPPIEGVTRAEVAMIVEYVRELQVANGIN